MTSTPALPVVKKKRRAARGFMLLVILLLGAAAFASAVVLISVGGSTQQLGVKAEAEDRARSLAWTGAERAFVYLEEVLTRRRDLDGVLDPASNCTARGKPVYDDGAELTYDGKVYTRVAVGEGAYLTRFFDDADDLLPSSTATRAFTDNNPCCGGCAEGTADDNPARDRNRSVYAEVIGYFPGADITRASHRVRLVRQFVSIAPVAELAVTVSGPLVADDVKVCAPLGDIGVGADVTVTGTLGMCGHLSAGGAITAPVPSTPSPACDIPCGPEGAPMAATPLVPEFPGVPNLLRATSGCNFYLRTRAAGLGGMWTWNPARSYGGGTSCASYVSATVPIPSTSNAVPGYCWQPLMTLDAGAGFAIQDRTTQNGEGAGKWAFRANMHGAGVDGNAADAYPQWDTTCRGGTAGWPLPAGPGDLRCTSCNQPVVRYDQGGDFWTVTTQAAASAPPGVYFIVSGTQALDFQVAGGPTDTALRDSWAPMTIASLGALTVTGQAGRISTGMGAPYPSLVVKGPLTIDAPLEFAGNVFVDVGNPMAPALLVRSNARFFGRLHVRGGALFERPLRVDYYRSLADPNASPEVFPTPVTSRTPL